MSKCDKYVGVDKYEEYRQKAEYCRRKADVAVHQDTKDEWLSIAESWSRMIRKSPLGDQK